MAAGNLLESLALRRLAHTEADAAFTAMLSHYSFPMATLTREQRLEYAREILAVPDAYRMYGAFAGDEGVASFTRIAFSQTWNGRATPVSGLAGVKVHPAWRRRGIARWLCEQAVRADRDEGLAINVLYPFRPDFYARLGWGMIGAWHDLEFSPSALPEPSRALGGSIRVIEAREIALLKQCDARWAAQTEGAIVRHDLVWTRMERKWPGICLGYFDARGELAGYVTASHEALATGQALWTTGRLVYTSGESFAGVLEALRRFGDQVHAYRVRARPADALWRYLRDPRHITHDQLDGLTPHRLGTLTGNWMLRVNDPSKLGLATDAPEGRVDLALPDPLVTDAGGTFRFEVMDGQLTVRKVTPSGDAGACDRGTFSAMWTGVLAPRAAALHGRLSGLDAAQLDWLATLFARPEPWMTEEF